MPPNLLSDISAIAAVLALSMNPYLRYVQDWPMKFGRAPTIGLLGTIALGIIGMTTAWPTERRRILLGANVIGVIAGLVMGYGI